MKFRKKILKQISKLYGSLYLFMHLCFPEMGINLIHIYIYFICDKLGSCVCLIKHDFFEIEERVEAASISEQKHKKHVDNKHRSGAKKI
jgi:hypothetical protein